MDGETFAFRLREEGANAAPSPRAPLPDVPPRPHDVVVRLCRVWGLRFLGRLCVSRGREGRGSILVVVLSFWRRGMVVSAFFCRWIAIHRLLMGV